MILVSVLMSLEVQSCNFWEDGRFFPLWTSKDIKQLTKIKIIFLVLLSAFIFLPMMSASSISEHFHISTWILPSTYCRYLYGICTYIFFNFFKRSLYSAAFQMLPPISKMISSFFANMYVVPRQIYKLQMLNIVYLLA